MKDFIEAMQIFANYVGDYAQPFHCEHDVMHVCIEFSKVSEEDQIRLNKLHFGKDENGNFYSSYYGSC
jgi:hypothetical protein